MVVSSTYNVSKTKISSAVISVLQYAEDAALQCLTADGLQRSLDDMSETYLRARPMINATKTKILCLSSNVAPTFSISWKQPKNSENFIYLGSILSSSIYLSNEIQRRINLASSAFVRLSKRVFGNRKTEDGGGVTERNTNRSLFLYFLCII